jgi:uncharacterized protein (TIGR03083 family)
MQDPKDRLRRYAQAFLKFATEDPVRYQLLYQRTIPGFEPTAESYEIAVRGLEYTRRALRECGITSQRAVDAWTAVLSGVAAQQNSNEPGGKRWLRLADEMTAMYLAHYLPKASPETEQVIMKDIRVEDVPPLEREEAMQRAETEIDRLLATVDDLSDTDWMRPTECVEWTVRDTLCHLLGMWELQADPEERARQIKAAAQAAQRSGKLRIDELTALQVSERAHLSPADLRQALHDAAPRGLAARANLPPELRATPYDPAIPGAGMWTFGYLFDVIHTRDPWMHRIDICRATGRELALSADHDGRIIEDVVAEWARKHGQPFVAELTGPAGGRYISGTGGESIHLDAIEFCRILSGRAPGTGLLATPIIF